MSAPERWTPKQWECVRAAVTLTQGQLGLNRQTRATPQNVATFAGCSAQTARAVLRRLYGIGLLGKYGSSGSWSEMYFPLKVRGVYKWTGARAATSRRCRRASPCAC